MAAQESSGTRVGIADVARAAGVSITTVSHALNNRGTVSPATRQRVRDEALRLGYAPNRIASALRSQRSGIIGFVSDDLATTPYAGRIVLGAQDAAAARDQLLVVVNSNGDSSVEAAQIAALVNQRVDVVVYARMFHRDTEVPDVLDGVPTVLVDVVDRRGLLPAVVPDEEQIARLALRTLLDAGHRRIVHLTLTTPGPAVELRAAAYEALMREEGLEPVVVAVDGDGDASAGRRALTQVLESGDERPTAAFCFNDRMAMGAYQAAFYAGLNVPADISVVGIDDFTPIAAELLPGLTTVSLPHYEMGRWAVESALDALDGGAIEPAGVVVRLPGELVRRGSVALAPR